VGERIRYNPTPPPNFIDSSLVIHYDGSQWIDFPVHNGSHLSAVWGYSPTDVWAGGSKGTLFHYDGSRWEKFSMPENYWFASIDGFSEDDVYASTYWPRSYPYRDEYYMIHWDGVRWREIDSYTADAYVAPKFGLHLKVIDGTLYSAGRDVFRKTDDGWDRIYYHALISHYNIGGTASDNIFVVGSPGVVSHHNGEDWRIFPQFYGGDFDFNSVWTDGKEVFIVGKGNGISVVLHGK
jgi:hypothetical protein